MTVKIIKHPLIDHYMNLLRSKDTKNSDFRIAAKLISKLMGYEIFKNLKSQDAKIKTPLDKFEGRELQKPFPCLVSILRAGSIIVEGLLDVFPNCSVGHIGIYRDHNTLLPQDYMVKLPNNLEEKKVFLCDPMLATGGSAIRAIEVLNENNCYDITLVCLLACEEGIDLTLKKFPKTIIFSAQKDLLLNEKGYIVPGLGDAGDRIYGTE